MPDVTVTAEAITNLSAMIESVNKQRSLLGLHVLRIDDPNDFERLMDEAIQVVDRAWELLYAIDTAFTMAKGVQGGRVYADLDGLEFIGHPLHGGIVKHRNGHVQVHT